ncbi:hypothetical protein ACPXCS_08495 [Streptomyces sp. DT190]|uniref:hypothetical protein n=1 Tax=unclassified Streptomyces TaxID=2593676 RepID=UPI003CEAB164
MKSTSWRAPQPMRRPVPLSPPRGDIFGHPPELVPDPFTLGNYRALLTASTGRVAPSPAGWRTSIR